MTRYEYKVVPAPRKAPKARGLKSAEDRFAHALTQIMNDLGADGWDYLRAETLPCEERSGWTSKAVVTQHMLVFRRALAAEAPRRPERPVVVAQAARPAPAPEPPPPLRRDAGDVTPPRLGPARGDG